jgi:hypothetical protein
VLIQENVCVLYCLLPEAITLNWTAMAPTIQVAGGAMAEDEGPRALGAAC